MKFTIKSMNEAYNSISYFSDLKLTWYLKKTGNSSINLLKHMFLIQKKPIDGNCVIHSLSGTEIVFYRKLLTGFIQ